MDHIHLFKGCGEKFLDYVSVLLREVQVSKYAMQYVQYIERLCAADTRY
jgi:hypothetical protein